MLLTYYIGQTIFIHFDKLVNNIKVTITNNHHQPVLSRTFTSTNFVKLSDNKLEGKVHLEIDYDGEHITKSLNIV